MKLTQFLFNRLKMLLGTIKTEVSFFFLTFSVAMLLITLFVIHL